MKTIVIGDIHGRDTWKKIVEANSTAAEVIFIGDYFDSHDDITPEAQIKNFRNICQYASDHYPKVKLLIGNHDFHYMHGHDERYSGFNAEAAEEIATVLEHAYHEGLLQMCHYADEVFYTHAGITSTWLANREIWPYEDGKLIEREINELFAHSRKSFCFTGTNPYGDDPTQSPIWVRPNSLAKDYVQGFRQVVGHTQMDKIMMSGVLTFIDVLGTAKQFLVVRKGIMTVATLNG